jgi:hypothetical protein
VFCCAGFQNHITLAGERGLAILVKRIANGLAFEFQSRGVAYEDQSKLHPIPIEMNINIASSVGLRYCPWCGAECRKMLESAPDFFSQLARKHESLLTLVL